MTDGDGNQTEGDGPGADDRGTGASDDAGNDGTDEVNDGGTGIAGLDADCSPGLFGDVLVGQASVAEIRLTNDSPQSTGPIETWLASPDSFEIASDQCEGVSLDPGETCTVRVRYEPVEVGEQASNMLRFGAGDSVASCSLNGDGVVRVNVTRTCTAGTVVSEPAGLECGPTCSSIFRTSDITLSQTPEVGARFFGWTGACEGTDACELTASNGQVDVGAKLLKISQPVDVGTGGRTAASSAAVDADGGLHLVLRYDAVGQGIHYGYRSPAGLWSKFEVLDPDSYTADRLSLGVDAGGAVHIAYVQAAGATSPVGSIRYVRRAPSADWEPPVTLDAATSLNGPSLALDSNNRVHVVYAEREVIGRPTALKHVFQVNQSAFSDAERLSGGTIGTYPSATFDDQDRLHVAYANGEQETLDYIERTSSGTWGQPEVVVANRPRFRVSLTSDSRGQLHLTFHPMDADDLRYIRRGTDGQWAAPEIVDSTGEMGPAWADDSGRVHLVYPNSDDDLVYAIRNEDGEWSAPHLLETQGNFSSYVSTSIDAANQVHVAYIELTEGDARYLQLGCP